MKKDEDVGKPRVVLVDDDPDFQTILRGWLEPHYDTVSFLGGTELVEDLHSLEPDLVILDINLPGQNGLKLCEKLRRQDDLAGLPVLFLTASRAPTDFVKNLEVGGSSYMTKPVERGALLRRVKDLLQTA